MSRADWIPINNRMCAIQLDGYLSFGCKLLTLTERRIGGNFIIAFSNHCTKTTEIGITLHSSSSRELACSSRLLDFIVASQLCNQGDTDVRIATPTFVHTTNCPATDYTSS